MKVGDMLPGSIFKSKFGVLTEVVKQSDKTTIVKKAKGKGDKRFGFPKNYEAEVVVETKERKKRDSKSADIMLELLRKGATKKEVLISHPDIGKNFYSYMSNLRKTRGIKTEKKDGRWFAI
jgi:hypothetical protein